MTAPTPEYPSPEWYLQYLHDVGGIYQEAADALAAVTAERDQVAENLRASEKMREDLRVVLNQVCEERDQAQVENHGLADAYRGLVKQLADAPHDYHCHISHGTGQACDCWKAGL